MLRRLGVRLRLGEMRADLLGRVDERGIVGLHLDLRDDGGHVPFLLALVHFGADGLLEVVTDIALRHRPALWQIDDGNVLVNGCGDAKGTLDHVDLRSIAMGDDDLGVGVDCLEQQRRHLSYAAALAIEAVAEGEAAKRDDNALGSAGLTGDGHVPLPSEGCRASSGCACLRCLSPPRGPSRASR